jgi:iron(III) transport system permease protein
MHSVASNSATADAYAGISRHRQWLPRNPVRVAGLALVTVVVLAPIALIAYQSVLDGPFFMPRVTWSLSSYAFVWTDPEFFQALRTTLLLAVGMVAISVPLGAVLAFLIVRTDLPGRRWIEPLVLAPIFISAIVLAFGYVVAIGPVGFISLSFKSIFGFVPWNVYSLGTLIAIAGLSHAPHVYLYTASALKNLNPEVEEAARTVGAGVWRVAFTVSLPLVMPALVFSGTLIFLLGFEMFGLVLILGDQGGIVVLTTYLYKLTNLLGTPSYHLMAVVAIVIVVVTLPLVILQRRLLHGTAKYATVRGKGMAHRPLPLRKWRWPAVALVMLWLTLTIFLPLAGLVMRAFVTSWGEGINMLDALTLSNFENLFQYPNLVRSIVNTILLAAIGGAMAVIVYTLIALIVHRWHGRGAAVLDYVVITPRALPGLIAGLAFLWIFLFVPFLTPFRSTLISLWVAYTVVWIAYGMRLISSTLMQVGPELEEAGRVTGAGQGRVMRDITIPLIRYGLLGSWLLIFMTFTREYSTGVYLLGPNTEVIGSMIVSLFGSGGLDLVAALSVINVLLTGLALVVALKFGVRVHA